MPDTCGIQQIRQEHNEKTCKDYRRKHSRAVKAITEKERSSKSVAEQTLDIISPDIKDLESAPVFLSGRRWS